MTKFFDCNTMTEQEVFDASVSHIISQGKPSANEDGGCNYRMDGGLVCAAGIFIRDEEYGEELEGFGWGDVVGANARHVALIDRLQGCHDDAVRYVTEHVSRTDRDRYNELFIWSFIGHAKQLASDYGLNTTVLDTTTKGD